MEKQQLIEYLDAVCDAESAVQACNEAIEAYKAQIASLPNYDLPSKPTMAAVHADSFANSDQGTGKTMGCMTAAGMFLLLAMFGSVTDMSLGSIFTYVIIPGIAVWFISKRAFANSAFKKAQQDAKDNYAKEYQIYQDRTAAYNKSIELQNATRSMLELAIRKQETLRESAREKLNNLYAANTIYPSVQNLLATYQIREYLKMGICDMLEGPTGAYAQYMEDVRTARICNSITDLKRSLTSAIHGLQGTLARELQQIDSNLNSIRGEIGTSMSNLTTQMQQMHNATATQLDAHFNEANRHLTRMGENIAISAHNQYIEQRLRNVDTYLLKMPNSF